MLFDPDPQFTGLPEEGFDLFSIPGRVERRRLILETIHPQLHVLGEDLVTQLAPVAHGDLHLHLPRLDWPRNYQPFCTWLALSYEVHGYQSGPQLNVGVHADHVTVRLGWDTSAAAFGRFEFLCRIGHLDGPLLEATREAGLHLRVHAAAPWPDGSRLVFESAADLEGSFAEVHRRGVWWEIGRRYPWPAERELICSEQLGAEAARIFKILLPVFDRLLGERGIGHSPALS
ncbi:DUF1054 family protein [bacterium]|nr:DUF1054 family protein [bacterium]